MIKKYKPCADGFKKYKRLFPDEVFVTEHFIIAAGYMRLHAVWLMACILGDKNSGYYNLEVSTKMVDEFLERNPCDPGAPAKIAVKYAKKAGII